MKFAYDPFNRDEDREREREQAARAEFEHWSRTQSLHGNSAAQRECTGVWVKRLPEALEEGRS